MSEPLIQFDDPPRNGRSDAEPATARIAATLKSAGIDAPNSLYDEALELAREGHLGQAVGRLQMLLCLDPDDADALVLLAKLHLAQGRPGEALARLDASISAGGIPPAGFREQLETAIRAERAREEEHRARIAAREQGEIRSLRGEARALRSEQVRLETELAEAQLRERNWKYAALGTSVLATIVILVLVFANARSGGPEALPVEAPAAAEVAPADAASASEATLVPAAPAETKPTEGAVTKQAAPAPDGTSTVRSSAVLVSPTASKPAEAAATKPAASTPATSASKPEGGGRVHEVAAGDTLQKIAARYYGDGARWEQIRDANKKILKNGVDLAIGMKLTIP